MPRVRSLAPPLVVAIVVAAVALLAAPSRPSAPASASASASASATVVRGGHAKLGIQSYAYAPATLTVRAGTVIAVNNRDATAHTVTAKQGGFDSGTVAPGRSVSLTVRTPGTYTYYCQFHAFMTGTIKVLP